MNCVIINSKAMNSMDIILFLMSESFIFQAILFQFKLNNRVEKVKCDLILIIQVLYEGIKSINLIIPELIQLCIKYYN